MLCGYFCSRDGIGASNSFHNRLLNTHQLKQILVSSNRNAIELNDLEVQGSVSHYLFPKPCSPRVFSSVFWKETSIV